MRKRKIDLISRHICFLEFTYKFLPKDLRETDILCKKRKYSLLPSHTRQLNVSQFENYEQRTRNLKRVQYVYLSMKINKIREEKEKRNIRQKKLGVIPCWTEHLKFPCKFFLRYLREKDIASENREKRKVVRVVRATEKYEEL